MNGISQPGYKRVRGGANGPSAPTIVVTIDGEEVELYDIATIAAQFIITKRSAQLNSHRGYYGPIIMALGITHHRKSIVDNFLPARRGPKKGK